MTFGDKCWAAWSIVYLTTQAGCFGYMISDAGSTKVNVAVSGMMTLIAVMMVIIIWVATYPAPVRVTITNSEKPVTKKSVVTHDAEFEDSE